MIPFTRTRTQTARTSTARRVRLLTAGLAVGLLATACGDSAKVASPRSGGAGAGDPIPSVVTTGAPDGPTTTGGDDADTPSSESPTTTAPDGSVPPPGTSGRGDVVGSIDEAQSATIQIVVKGSLRDPEVGPAIQAGSGSGFIISEDGYAVTNNHVVTGAATLEVFVGGDRSTSYNARVVGVSECNDLALIDIDSSEPLPRFAWYDGEIAAGLDVYAAGFPLGDPQFTLTRGIISKAKAGGDLTGTSSIDHTVEHDANTQPGNSGGPLLDAQGRVVAVNYAGGSRTNTDQFFSISSDLAQGVVEHLYDGDFESLGINGWAVASEDGSIAGIWVAGVAPGSPASQARILPGDIVTSMNGLPVGTDGTFKDYCDVIRTAGDRPIDIEVLRFDTSEVLRGEVNGDRPLELAFSFAETIEQGAGAEPGAAYTSYVAVTDDTGSLTVEVPAAWSDVQTSSLQDEAGGVIPFIAASTDLQALSTTWDVPGVQFGALLNPSGDVGSLLAQYAPGTACVDGGIQPYDDGAFVGAFQVWQQCGGGNTLLVVLATVPADGSPFALITMVQAVSEADLAALDHILATFNVTG